MKKRRQILLALIGIILVLAACSNESAAEPDRGEVPSSAGIQGENKEGQTASEDVSSMSALDKEKPASEKDESGSEATQDVENTQPKRMDGYPSAAEISAALEDGKGIVYWLAPGPTVPDVCKTLNAETVNTEALWNTILDRVFENASLTEKAMPDGHPYRCYQFNWNDQSWDVEISDVSITLHSDADIDENILDSILDILTELTGMGVSFENGEINHYVFTYNGLTLDEHGYSLRGGEWIPESVVSLDDDRISIRNPVVIQDDCETIGTETLLTMDSARTIYEAYWMASSVPLVPVVTNVELVYYFTDGQLLPAWRLNGQAYVHQNCHDIVALLDAVTGEVIRDT